MKHMNKIACCDITQNILIGNEKILTELLFQDHNMPKYSFKLIPCFKIFLVERSTYVTKQQSRFPDLNSFKHL